MEKLSEIKTNEFGKIVISNADLKQRFEEFIYYSVIDDYLGEKTDCFEPGCIEYSFGVCFDCYMRLKKHYGYIDHSDAVSALMGVQKSIKLFGATDELERMAAHCENLEGSNLFIWHVEKLLERYFKDEFQPSIDWVEDISYKLYLGQMPDDLESYLECFQDQFDGYLYDRENGVFYEPRNCKIA